MISQLEKDLIHLEGSRDRLDEYGGPNGSYGDTDEFLGIPKYLVPEPCLQVAFGLRQIEIRATSAVQQLASIVKEVQTEVHEGAYCRLAVHEHVPFVQVPATWTYHKSCETTFVEPVGLAFRRLKGQAPAHRIGKCDLAGYDVRPMRGVRIFQVGQPDARP